MARSALRFLLPAGFLVATAAGSPLAGTDRTIIVDATLIDARATSPRPHQSVALRQGRIVAVGPRESVGILEGDEVVAAAGLYLIPGLWDAHVHLSFWGEPEHEGGATTGTVADPEAYADVLPRFVAWGVTTVRDMGGNLEEIDRWRARVEQEDVVGPRIIRAGPYVDGPKPNDKYRVFVTNAQEARECVRSLKDQGVDFIKVHSKVPRDALVALAAEAKAQGVAFAGHVPEGLTLSELSGFGQRTIEHADSFFISRMGSRQGSFEDWRATYAWYATEEGLAVLEQLAQNRTALTPTLAVFDTGWERTPEPWIQLRQWYRDLTFLAHQRGVRLLAGTDVARRSSPVQPGRGLHQELEHLVALGLSPWEALRAATLTPAETLNRHEDLGTIEPGKLADLVLLEGNPLDDIRNTQRIAAVVLRGRMFGPTRLLALRDGANAPTPSGSPTPLNDPETPARLSTAEWRDDLRFLAAQLEQWHANLYHTVSREDFGAAVTRLHDRIPDLQAHEIIVGMSRIVAMVNDAHTHLFPPTEGPFAFREYGVQYEWFQDGLFVKAADRSLSSIVGARVLEIGNQTAEAALAAAAPIGYRENDMTTRISAPRVLRMPEVLHALGIIDAPGAAPLVVETRAGERRASTLKPYPATTVFDWIDAREGAEGEAPLYLKRLGDAYWFAYLETENTLYVQLNRCEDQEREPLTDFAKRIHQSLKDTGAKKLILDVRHNIGGNWQATLPLVHLIVQTPKINQKGRFFVIIGRRTLSATVVMLGELRWHTNATLVGEPTGARPNLYGENPFAIELPNSRLGVKWASEFFQPAGAFERGEWIAPEIAAEVSSSDYFANRDPALAAALNYRGAYDLEDELLAADTRGGFAAAKATYEAFRAKPANKFADTFEAVRRFGNGLLDSGRNDEALAVFEWNRAAYSERARTYIRLAHAHALSGAKSEAHRLFQTSLERLSSDRTLYRSLRFALEKYVREGLRETAE